MDKLEYELVTLNNGKQYFVLESIMYEYDIYDLVLNVEDENDTKIVVQEIKNGKTVLNDVKDEYILKTLSAMFKEKIEAKQNSIN
jgi:transcriptional regulator of NAD metabolism